MGLVLAHAVEHGKELGAGGAGLGREAIVADAVHHAARSDVLDGLFVGRAFYIDKYGCFYDSFGRNGDFCEKGDFIERLVGLRSGVVVFAGGSQMPDAHGLAGGCGHVGFSGVTGLSGSLGSSGFVSATKTA